MANKPSRKTSVAAIVGILVVLAPILYFLSLGPALVMLRQGTVSKQQVSTFYLPLLGLGQVAPPFGALTRWYGSLWVDLDEV